MVTQAGTANKYSQWASRNIHKPRDRKPSIHIYSRSKVGKTYFCASAPKVLILDPVGENGTDQLKKNKPDVITVNGWRDFDNIYKYIKSGQHEYEYIAFDGMTRFSNMALHYVRAQQEEIDLSRTPGMVSLPDYRKANELVKGMLNNFHTLPIGKIYTSHERRLESEKADVEPDEESMPQKVRYVPDLPNGVRSSVNALADVIGRLYKVKTAHPEDENKIIVRRRIWLGYDEMLDTGFRSEYKLPDYLGAPTVPRLVNLIENGKA